uniref:Peptidase M12A domain-containing protein n=1 Tax=Poecilia reticulata TaxID=8081 RepID=A0A3P9N885_POERE
DIKLQGMTPSTSLLLLLMLGLSQALPLKEGGEQEEKKEGGEVTMDITTKILTTNNVSDKMLLEGDIVLPKNRNAMKCWYNSCLWSKASNGYVVVPYVIGREFTSYERQTIKTSMRAFANSTCVHFQERTNKRDFISICDHTLMPFVKTKLTINPARNGGQRVTFFSVNEALWCHQNLHQMSNKGNTPRIFQFYLLFGSRLALTLVRFTPTPHFNQVLGLT